MEVTIGKEGLHMSWQEIFPEETECCRCKGPARIGFVAVERGDMTDIKSVASLHENRGKGSYWLHDLCAVAVYFCRECLEPTALYNQA